MPRGRAASPIRPGLFIRSHLLHAGEDHPSAIHRALKDMIEELNQARSKPERLRGPTFASFYRYLKQLEYFGLLELSGKEEPVEFAPPSLLYISNGETRPAAKRFYQLTGKGKSEPPHEAFSNPVGTWVRQGFSYGR